MEPLHGYATLTNRVHFSSMGANHFEFGSSWLCTGIISWLLEVLEFGGKNGLPDFKLFNLLLI